MVVKATVMQLARTKAAPNRGIRPFQVMRMMVGTRITIREARRLRQIVVRSAFSRCANMAEVEGSVLAGMMVEYGCYYERISVPVRPMNTSSSVIFPLREARMTSGLSRLQSIRDWGESMAMIRP